MAAPKAIPLPRIKFDKKLARSQTYQIATDDGAVISRELPVASGCAVMPESCHAFEIDPDNQYLNENNMWVQVAGERSAIPKMSRKPHKLAGEGVERGLIEKVYKEHKELAKLQQFLKIGKNTLLDKIIWVVAIPSCAFVIMYAINHAGH